MNKEKVLRRKPANISAQNYCGECAIELESGKITFTKNAVDTFIRTYTNFAPDDFTKEMRKRLVLFVMTPLYQSATSKHNLDKDNGIERIVLPDIIFK
jgi:hypothetical protein